MSLTGSTTAPRKVTSHTLLEKKQSHQPITSLTAYDYPTARLIDESGIDLILVGDSVAMAVLGHPDTLSLTLDEMLHHAKAVRRGTRSALLCVDMPYGSYHVSSEDTLRNAIRLVKEAGAEAVKLEGGANRAPLVEQLTHAEIPVIGHIGLTPQSLHRMGGYRVQGRSTAAIDNLIADAAALECAGAIAIVLEGVPREVARHITAASRVPIIGIGAGPDCDGQILVLHDLANLTFNHKAKFVRRFSDAEATLREGIEHYRDAVANRSFPNDEESYHLPSEVRTAFEQHHTETI
jgi:3-methyl-2-oxobutanoate hydroxymethyltransferase